MALYRCLNSNCADGALPYFDFTADAPVCPKCAAGNEPRTARFIITRAIIHYDPPHPSIAGLGVGHPLCNLTRHVSHLHQTFAKTRVLEQATGEPSVVSCPACLAHPDFPKEEIDQKRLVPDWPIAAQAKNG